MPRIVSGRFTVMQAAREPDIPINHARRVTRINEFIVRVIQWPDVIYLSNREYFEWKVRFIARALVP